MTAPVSCLELETINGYMQLVGQVGGSHPWEVRAIEAPQAGAGCLAVPIILWLFTKIEKSLVSEQNFLLECRAHPPNT